MKEVILMKCEGGYIVRFNNNVQVVTKLSAIVKFLKVFFAEATEEATPSG